MKPFSKLMCISCFFLLFLSFNTALCFGGQLIEPTRTLQEAGEIPGRLTVFSEPPQLDVLLDGLKVGKTPVWLKNVKPGFHTLQIKDSDKEIYVKEGKTLRVGLFKGSFVTLPEKEKVLQKQAHVEGKKPDEVSKMTETPEQERRRDLTLWERFVSGTSGHF